MEYNIRTACQEFWKNSRTLPFGLPTREIDGVIFQRPICYIAYKHDCKPYRIFPIDKKILVWCSLSCTWWRRRRCHRISVIDSRSWRIGRARCWNECAVTRSVTFEHCVIIGGNARRKWRRIRNWRISGWSSWRVGCVKICLLLLLLGRMTDARIASAGCVRVVGWRRGGNRGWSRRDWRNDVVVIWKKLN
jgi:hypothetical protein